MDVSNLTWRHYHGDCRDDPPAAALSAVRTALMYSAALSCPEIVWCFDAPPYKRRDVYDGYKAKRRNCTADESAARDEIASCLHKLWADGLHRMGFSNVFRRPGYEADDVMAAVVRGLPEGDRVVLVTSDRDVYQLLGRSCAVFHPVAAHVAETQPLFTARTFKKIHGIKPAAWVTVKCVAGCPADAVPGVDGVGEKTAAAWLRGETVSKSRAKAIDAFVASPDYHRNQKLVRLPFRGLDPIPVTPDRRSGGGWPELCRALGRPAMSGDGDRSETRRAARASL